MGRKTLELSGRPGDHSGGGGPPSPAGLACCTEPPLWLPPPPLLWGEEHQALTGDCKHDGALSGPAPEQAAQLQDKYDSEQDVREEECLIFWIGSP